MNEEERMLEAVRDLYRRIREQELTADDIVPLSELEVPSNENYLEKIYRDRAEFEEVLGPFGDTFDIFRGFTPDQVVLDVGAHWGYSAVAMRHRGCTAKIISLEAMPLNVPPLKRLKSIDKGMYDFHNIAVSDSERVIRFYVPSINGHANTGLATTGGTLDDYFAPHLVKMAKAHRPRDGAKDRPAISILDVPAMRIDDIVGRLIGNDSIIAAIKMDVEGHEGSALRGARGLLNEQKPLLMVEGANRTPDVVSEMTSHGYFHCERHHGKLVPHAAQSDQNDGFWLHPDRLAYYRSLGIFDAEGPLS